MVSPLMRSCFITHTYVYCPPTLAWRETGQRIMVTTWSEKKWNMNRMCIAILLCAGLVELSPAMAEEPSSTRIGTQTVGLVVGGMLPVRLMEGQSSKLNGVAVHPSWEIGLTDPIGTSWWSGSVGLGVEGAILGIAEPTGAYAIGLTPKLTYTFTSFGRLKPYVEGGGGPVWTNFDGHIPEQGSDFNFLVWGGTGAALDITAQWSLNVGFRFSHISNAGTDSPNGGLNYLLPFVGISTKLF
ncbi:lipid A 3-O-deacylase [Nitrospira sp.]|nr:lipid A 3-O-deacylase [Nitrospira sp.]